MSIKIYIAFRVPIYHLYDAIELISDALEEQAIEEFINIKNLTQYKDLHYTGIDWNRYVIKVSKAVNQCYKSWGLITLHCTLQVWIQQDYAYFIPRAAPCYLDLILKLFKAKLLPNYIEPYEYFDNADPPSCVTAAEWEHREQTWKRVCLDNWPGKMLELTIVDAEAPGGLLTIDNRIRKNKALYKDRL
jgi:hypothetical protein